MENLAYALILSGIWWVEATESFEIFGLLSFALFGFISHLFKMLMLLLTPRFSQGQLWPASHVDRDRAKPLTQITLLDGVVSQTSPNPSPSVSS
jgi:hypothetical protein